MSERTSSASFTGLGIAPRLLDIIAGLKFTTPTPIQEKAIPVAIEGKDIIGTPGRINDHLNQKTLSLNGVSILVLDEADRMLDMGFAPQIKQILHKVPKDRQTM